MNDKMKLAAQKLLDAARLLVEHAPPGDELENAEVLQAAKDAQQAAEGSETP